MRHRLFTVTALALLALTACETVDKYEQRDRERDQCERLGGRWEQVDPFSNQGLCHLPR